MNFLVTGSAGFLGYHLSKQLLIDGHRVIGVDNLNDDYEPKLKKLRLDDLSSHPKYSHHNDDLAFINPKEFVSKIDIDINYVYHFASKDYQYEKPSDVEYTKYLQGNVITTSNIFECANLLDVKMFIYASTSTLYGKSKKTIFTEKDLIPKPLSPQGASKLSAEKAIEFLSSLYYIPSIIFRIGTVYGPFMRPHMLIPNIIDSVMKDKEIQLYSDIESKRDYLYIDDAVKFFKSVINKRLSFQIMNIGSGTSTDIKTIIQGVANILRVDYSQIKISDYHPDYNQIVTKKIELDISKAKKVLGFTPNVDIQKGLKYTVDFYKNNSDILRLTTG